MFEAKLSGKVANKISQVFILEDNSSISVTINKILTSQGYEVVTAGSIAEGLKKTDLLNNCIMLLDYQLEDGNSIDFLNELLSLGISYPFICMTVHKDPKIAVELMKLGARDYVIKDDGLFDVLPDLVNRTCEDYYNKTKLGLTLDELHFNEEYLKRILEATSDGILVVDAKGKISHFNEKFCVMWKIPMELLAQNSEQLILTVILNQLLEPDRFLEKVEEIYKSHDYTEDLIYFKDGRVFERYSAPLLKDGSSIGRAWSFKDVTELTKMVRSLTKSEQKYRNILENIQNIFYRIDSNRNVVMTNRSGYVTLGYQSEDELLGKPISSFVKNPRLVDNLEITLLRNGKYSNVELELIKTDGSRISILASGNFYYSDEGKRIGVEGFCTDITELKKVQNALTEERNIFFAGPTIVIKIIIGESWLIGYSSPNVKKILGGAFAEISSNSVDVRTLIHPDDLPEVITQIERSIDAGAEHIEQTPFRIINKNGDSIWLKLYSSLSKDDDTGQVTMLCYGNNITKQIENEKSIKENAARLELVMDSTKAAMWDWNIKSDAMIISGKWDQITGYQLRDLQPFTFSAFVDLIHPDDREVLKALVEAHFNDKIDTFEIETRIKNLEKNWVYILSRGKVVERDKAGNPTRMVGNNFDINARKIAEVSLKRISEDQRILLDTITTQVWYLRDPYTYGAVNKAHAKFLGKQKPTLFEEKITNIFDEDTSRALLRYNKQAFEKGNTVTFEMWIPNFRREMRLLSITLTPKVTNKVIEYVVCSGEDITSRRRVEDELHNQKDSLQKIFNSVAVAMLLVDKSLKIKKINRAASKLLGYAEKDLLNKSLGENILCLSSYRNDEFQYDYSCSKCKIRTAVMDVFINELPVYDIDDKCALKTKDNGIKNIWANFSVEPVFLENENYTVLSIKDITESKEVFEQLKDAKASAEMIAEKLNASTQELEFKNLELDMALHKAEKANKTKDQFLANVSHDIRTPLSVMIGMTEILKTKLMGTEYVKDIDFIANQGEFLLTLINDILDKSKIDAGKMDFERSSVDLTEIVDRISMQVTKKLESNNKNDNVKFIVNMSDKVPQKIISDELRLYQILMNLTDNAVKFTSEGSITLEIENVTVKGQDVIRFEITDTGIGIPKKTVNEIFAGYTQADGSTTRKYGGTGLGTTIARELVELMGGKIGAKSVVDEGSTFWFYLPLVGAVSGAVVKPKQIETNNEIDVQGFKGKILLAEDVKENQDIIRILLEKTQLELDVVVNGLFAVKKCEEVKYDLILMDIQMPEMDGFDATKRIKQTDVENVSKNISTPIIGVTAYSGNDVKNKGLEVGMDNIIIKPVRKHLLYKTLSQYFGDDVNNESTINENVNEDKEEYAAEIDNLTLNMEQALYEFGDNEEMLFEVLKGFSKELIEYQSDIYSAIKEKEIETLRKKAHKLRGASANLTAMPLSRVAGTLEELAEQKDLAKAKKILPELNREIQLLYNFIKKNIN